MGFIPRYLPTKEEFLKDPDKYEAELRSGWKKTKKLRGVFLWGILAIVTMAVLFIGTTCAKMEHKRWECRERCEEYNLVLVDYCTDKQDKEAQLCICKIAETGDYVLNPWRWWEE